MLLEFFERFERPLRYPGRAAGLADLPIVRVDPKEPDPIGDFAPHPMIHRVVDKARDIYSHAGPGLAIDINQLAEAVFLGFIIATVFDQDMAVVLKNTTLNNLDWAPAAFLFLPFLGVFFNFFFLFSIIRIYLQGD